jgi:hypothetical protein
MESIKNAAHYVSETVHGKGSEASKEANKVSIAPYFHHGNMKRYSKY